MSNYNATVIKTGNSFALRVPMKYIDDANLALGQKIQLSDPLLVQHAPNRSAVQIAIKNLQQIRAFSGIKDPAAWQKEIRMDRPLPGRG